MKSIYKSNSYIILFKLGFSIYFEIVKADCLYDEIKVFANDGATILEVIKAHYLTSELLDSMTQFIQYYDGSPFLENPSIYAEFQDPDEFVPF